MPALIITNASDGSHRTYYLQQSETRVGSSEVNTCCVPSEFMAPNHFAIVNDGWGWWFINNERKGVMLNPDLLT